MPLPISYQARNINGLATETRLYKGADTTPVSKSQIEYDQTAYLNVGACALSGLAVGTWNPPPLPPGTQRVVFGHATTTRTFSDVHNPATAIEAHVWYDRYGNVVQARDALGRESATTFSPDYGCAYPTAASGPAPNPTPDAHGNPAKTFGSDSNFSTTSTYDFTTGLPLTVTDANNQTVTNEYDEFLRPKKVLPPVGGAESEVTYHDLPPGQAWGADKIWVEKKAQVTASANSAQWTKRRAYFDGLGRAIRNYSYNGSGFTVNGASCPWSGAETEYDIMGRVQTVTQPYYAQTVGEAAPANIAQTESFYDDLGRVTKVRAPDGAEVTTAYALKTDGAPGTVVTVTDPTGKQRRSLTDGLGRLVRVDEPDKDSGNLGTIDAPAQPTSYVYDIQGNLRTVTQSGVDPATNASVTQTRHFLYDSRARLLAVKNPEQGTLTRNGPFAALPAGDPLTGYNGGWSMAYLYDANGNLIKRRDARDIDTSYTYDNLNRLTTTTYSDGTPTVKRYYDGYRDGQWRGGQSLSGLPGQPANGPTLDLQYAKGALWQSETAGRATVTIDQIDNLGRARRLQQQFGYANGTWSQPYAVARTYGIAGQVLTQTYPSGHTMACQYDEVGRLADVPAPAASPSPNPLPAVRGNLGDGVTRSYASAMQYDERGLLVSEKYGTVTPLYHKMHYNVRGQMWDMQLGTDSSFGPAEPTTAAHAAYNRGRIVNYYSNNFQMGQSGPDNNGNLLRQETFIPEYPGQPTTTPVYYQQTYWYDKLNRLTDVEEKLNGAGGVSWRQKFEYDRWGNRTFNQQHTWGAGVPKPEFAVERASNRLLAPNDPNLNEPERQMRYDKAGNLTTDTYTTQMPAQTGGRTYDAENRMMAAQTLQSNVVSWQHYRYDGDGRRIARFANQVAEGSPSPEIWQIYGFGGELLAEYAASALTILPQREYGYQGGKLLISAANGDNDRLRRFVENLYLRTWGYLDNGKTQADVNSLVTALGSAGQNNQAAMLQTAQDQATLLFNSDEYDGSQRTHEQFVADLYLAYLQRPPDGPGLAWWAWLLNSNQATRWQIRQDFATCGEFAALVSALHGVETSDYSRVDRFINNLYAAATGAFPSTQQYSDEHNRFDAAEAQGVTAVKEAGQALGRQLLGASANNFRQELGTEEYVTRLYQTFLRRVPDGSYDGYVTQANHPSQGRSYVLEQFLSMSAYREQTEALHREVLWLVSDHLGTPRLIAERTGRLEGIKRRDYLPFGESADALNGRSAAFGYGTDTTRQGFTGYEKDDETGLNYAQARYYASGMGRFMSVDPLLASAETGSPQSWNRYAYCENNPLNCTDPSGLDGGVWGYRDRDGGTELTYFESEDALYQANVGLSSSGLNQYQIFRGQYFLWADHTAWKLGSNGSHQEFSLATILMNTTKDANGNTINVYDSLVGAFRGDGGNFNEWQLTLLNALAESGGRQAEFERKRDNAIREAGYFLPVFAAVRVRQPLVAGESGRFSALDARAVPGDGLTPHHMPQAALGFTSREAGGAIMLPTRQHYMTRTYGGRGGQTARTEQGMLFRDVLARDMRDVRNIARGAGVNYNQGLLNLTQYYRANFPNLMAKPPR